LESVATIGFDQQKGGFKASKNGEIWEWLKAKVVRDTRIHKNGCLNFVHLAIHTRQPNVGTGMSLLRGTFTILVSLLLCWTFLLWITHVVLHVTMNHPAYVGNIFAMPAEK